MSLNPNKLPPPTSFSEGQRLIYGLLASLAGMFCGGMAIGMVAILMWGNWPKEEYHTIVVIFGWSLGGFIACMSLVIIGLLTGGPVGRFKGGLSKSGLTFETEDHNGQPPPTVEAAARGAAAGAVAAATPTEPEIKP